MSGKVLLINPWIYDFSAYDLWSKPLGLLYIASFLRKFGFEVSLIDCLDRRFPGSQAKYRAYGTGKFHRTIVEKPSILKHVPRHYARYGIPEDYFLRLLQAHKDVEAVLVTSIMTYWYPGVKHVVDLVKKYLPDRPVILGGIYASLLPEHARETIRPDYLVTGPGEIKTLRLLSNLFSFSLDESQLPRDLDEYPYPAFDLLPHLDYLVIMTSRGCPYDCSFCAQKLISMSYRRRHPDLVVDEMEKHYHRFKLQDFAFYDDALFLAADNHIKPILNKIIQRGLKLRLHSPNGLFVKLIDGELAELMKKSGFTTIRLSFETANEERRQQMSSKLSNDGMIRAVELLTRAGYHAAELEAYVMMGLPDQQPEEIIRSMIFVHELGLIIRLASFSPIHGTKEFNRAVEMGLISADIDPLLTNKSIYPLSREGISYASMNKMRKLANILNESARRGKILFRQQDERYLLKEVGREEEWKVALIR